MIVKGQNWKLGADPEIFVKDPEGSFVSAHGLVEGTKQQPFPVEKGAVQVDGLALEFNIDPADNYEEFQGNLDIVQEQLASMIGNKEFLREASVRFSQELLDDVPEFNKVLGCEADYNGWTLESNDQPDQGMLMRTAGGHVHLGGFETEEPFGFKHFSQAARMARLLDSTLGAYSLFWDKDDDRRLMYGQAGCFRPKFFGMEYRSLSNAWLFNPGITRFVYEGAKEAIGLWMDGKDADAQVAEIINKSDRNSSFFHNNPKVEEVLSLC